MKRIIIFLIIVSISYCSLETCSNESDLTKCANHQISEHKGFSCYKYSYQDDTNDKGCFPFPDEANSQKSYIKIMNGMLKEIYSGTPKYAGEEYSDFGETFTLKKESYSKGEEIIIVETDLSEEDKKRIKG